MKTPTAMPRWRRNQAAKAVITATDSGGALELIANGENGYVVDPSPRAIAAAMDRLYTDRRLARQLGEAGRAELDRLDNRLGYRYEKSCSREDRRPQ